MLTFYHIYCDTTDVFTITPDFNHAKRTFNSYMREYPDEVIDFDSITGNNNMQDIASGIFEGKRVRIMQCQPQEQR